MGVKYQTQSMDNLIPGPGNYNINPSINLKSSPKYKIGTAVRA